MEIIAEPNTTDKLIRAAAELLICAPPVVLGVPYDDAHLFLKTMMDAQGETRKVSIEFTMDEATILLAASAVYSHTAMGRVFHEASDRVWSKLSGCLDHVRPQ